MGRLVLPLEPHHRQALAQLSHETGLSIAALLGLQRRGFRLVRDQSA